MAKNTLCELDSEVQSKVIAVALQRLENFNKAKAKDAEGKIIPFDMKSFVKQFFNDVLAKTQNPKQTLLLTQSLPMAMDSALVYMSAMKQNTVRDNLIKNGVSQDEIMRLKDEFSDLDSVANYVKKDDETFNEHVERILNINPKRGPGRPTKIDVLNRSLADILKALPDEFKAMALDFNSTTGQETEEGLVDPKTGKTSYSNRRDPAKFTQYNTLKTILAAFEKKKLDSMEDFEYDGHKGFKLAAGVNKIPKSTKEGPYILTITDNNGAPILFNEAGKIDRVNGTAVSYTLRMPNETKNKELVDSVIGHQEAAIRNEALKNNLSEKETKEIIANFKEVFTLYRQSQIDSTNEVIKTLVEKPDSVVLLDINNGSKGYIEPHFTPLSKVWDKLSTKEKGSIRPHSVSGFPSIQLDSMNEGDRIELRAKKMINNMRLVQNIVDILIKPITVNGKLLDNKAKVAYVKQFVYSGLRIETDNNNNIVLEIKKTNYNLIDPKISEKLVPVLLNLYLTVDNSLISKGTFKFYNIQPDDSATEGVGDYINDLLLQFLDINAVPNADGEIIPLNGYFTWSPSNDIIKAIQPKYEKTEDVKKIIDTVESSNPYSLEMSNLIMAKGTPEQIAAAKIWWKNSPLSKHIKLEVLNNIVNSNAWAHWNVSGITLFKGSDYTHTYHEAWHAFSQLYLSKSEKTDLYSEVAKQPGSFQVAIRYTDSAGKQFDKMKDVLFSKATPKQLEEYIAEEFRKFAISGGTKSPIQPVRKSIFQKIWNLLKELFTGVRTVDVVTQPEITGVLAEIFDKLYVGDINQYSAKVENMMFDSLNSGIIDPVDQKDMMSYADSKLITNSIDGLVSKWMSYGFGVDKEGGSYATTRAFRTEKNRLFMFGIIKGEMQKRVEILATEVVDNNALLKDDPAKWDIKKQQIQEHYVDILNKALENWGDPNNRKDDTGTMGFYKNYSEFADQMKAPILKEDGTPDIDSTDEKDTMKGLRGNDRKGNEMSSKELADSLTLYLVRSVLEVDKMGTPLTNELGFPKLASFSSTWNSLVRNISGISSIPELHDRLDKLSEESAPIYKQILKKLGDPKAKTKQEADMWLKFWQDFNKPRIPIIAFMIDKDSKGNMIFKIGRTSSATFRTINNWQSDFSSNLEKSRYITRSSTGDNKGLNTLNLKNIVADFIDEVIKDPKNTREIQYKIKKGEAFEFLKAIGINLTDNEYIRNTVNSTSYEIIVNKFVDMIALLNNSKAEIKNLSSPIDLFKEGVKGGGLRLFDRAEDKAIIISIPNLGGRLDELAELETEYSDQYSSLSRNTASGDKQYEQSLNNTMTGITDALNKAKRFQDLYTDYDNGDVNEWQHAEFLGFLGNPAARSSQLLNSVFILDIDSKSTRWGERRTNDDGTPVTIDIQNLSGALIKEHNKEAHGISHAAMGFNDKFITDFHSVLTSGFFENPRHGSKSTFYSTKPSTINTYLGKKQKHLYIDTVDCLPTVGSTEAKGTAEMLKIVKAKLQSEIERIVMVKENPLYKTYKGYEKGDQFTLFHGIFNKAIKNALLKPEFIAAVKANQIVGVTNGEGIAKALALPEFANLSKEVDKGLKIYFSGLVKDHMNNLLAKTNVVKKDGFHYDAIQPKIYEDILRATGKYETSEKINEALQRERIDIGEGKLIAGKYKNSEQIAQLREAAIKSFVFNTWIHNTEMITLFYGDICQYNHEKDEFNKRNSVFGSTGYIFPTDTIALSYINNQPNSMRDFSATIKGAAQKIHDGTFNTSIIRDNKVTSLYLDDFEKLLGKEVASTYIDMKEGDGQGWIGFDAYRILKRSEGKWSDPQENAYQDIIAGKQPSLKELVEIFPVYKLQYAGNLKTEKNTLPLTAIHKFSLFPLIPSVIKGSAMQSLHEEMIKQGTDYVLFESGSKLSSIGTPNAKGEVEADSIFDDTNTSKLKEGFRFTNNKIYLRNLKNQLDMNTEFKKTTTFSTQLRGLLNSGLIENGVPVDFMLGKSLSARKKAWDKIKTEGEKMKASPLFKLSRTFEKGMSRLVQLNLEKLTEEVGWSYNKQTKKPEPPLVDGKPDYTVMVDFIKKELEKQGFAKHEIDFLDVNEKGELIRDLSTSFQAPKIERLLMSIINNRIVKQHVTGEALVQVAVSFSQMADYGNKFRLPTEEQKIQFGTSGLPFYRPGKGSNGTTAACKIKVALQGDFENLFNTSYLIKNDKGEIVKDGKIGIYEKVIKTNKEGTEYTEMVINTDASLKRLNEMVKNEDWLNQDNNRKKITLTGVRIPVQGLNSMEFMEVYEFLPPAAGPIIILPTEIVAKSGGDFDVDKLTTYFPHITNSGSWVDDTEFQGDDWKEKIDAKIKATTDKFNKLANITLGEDPSIKNIQKQMKSEVKGKKAAAINVLLAQKESLGIQRKSALNTIKEELSKLDKTTPIGEDIKKTLKEEDDKGLIQRLDVYDKLGGLQNKGETLYSAYKELKSLGPKFKEVSDLITAEFKGEEGTVSAEFRTILNEFSDLQDQKKYFIKSVQNSLVQSIVNILATGHNAVPLLTPNSTHLTKEAVADHMEDRVQSFNFKKSRIPGEVQEEKGVSPTRVLEYDFNLKKHQDNVTGMGALGMTAIENKYNPIFNASGGHLTTEYTLSKVDRTTGQPVKLPVKVYLKHNTIPVTVDKKVVEAVSVSSLKDANGENSISEINSQLVNGFVDVEKNAWVAFIQGNMEVTPMILFLNRIGVPFKDVVTFVSNPLIREYAAEQKTLKGVLGELMGKPYAEEQVKLRARGAVLSQLGIKTRGVRDIFNEMEKVMVRTEGLDMNKLDKAIDMDFNTAKTDNQSKAALLQYLYLENLMSGYDQIKRATNVDTKKTGTLFDAQLRAQAVEDIKESPNMPDDIINYITKESSISEFFVQEYSSELWGPMFPLRNNEIVNKYLTKILKDYAIRTSIQNTTGYSPERIVSEFKNDLMSYLFINHIKNFEAGSSEYYKGMRTKTKIPVKYAEGINKAAFAKKEGELSTLFVNIKNINKEFNNRSYLPNAKGKDSYVEQGLATLDLSMFKNVKEYQNFVVEREYLRSVLSPASVAENPQMLEVIEALKARLDVKEGETKEQYDTRIEKKAYENFLRNRALDNTFNFYKMFKAKETNYPHQMIKLLDKYPYLKDNFSILKQFATKALKTVDKFNNAHINLILRDARDLDEDSITQYYDDIKKLSTDNTLVPGDTKKVALENKFINDFFKRLSLFAFTQSGMQSGTETAFTSVLPYDQYTDIITEAATNLEKTLRWKSVKEEEYNKAAPNNYLKKTTDKKFYLADLNFLRGFMADFTKINDVKNKSERVAGKDWTKEFTPTELQSESLNMPTITSNFVHKTATPNVFVLSNTYTDLESGQKFELNQGMIRNLAMSTSDTLFVINDSMARRMMSEPESKRYLENNFQNTAFMFAHPDFGYGTQASLRTFDMSLNTAEDISKAKTLLDEDIAVLKQAYQDGKKIVFMEGGYAQKLLQQSQLDTPEIVTRPKSKGKLAMQPDNVAQIKAGTKTLTNRTEKLEEGVYTLPDGTEIELIYEGVAKVTDSDIIDVTDDKMQTGSPFDKNTFAKREGFKSWTDFVKNNKFSANFIAGKQSRHVYSILNKPRKFTTISVINTAPKSEFFVYLSEQLSKLGYVNPGSERVPSIMDILAKKQIITQEEIDNRENMCK